MRSKKKKMNLGNGGTVQAIATEHESGDFWQTAVVAATGVKSINFHFLICVCPIREHLLCFDISS